MLREGQDVAMNAEVAALVDDLASACGVDVRGWAAAVLETRILRRAAAEGLRGVPELRARILDDPACRARLLVDLSARPRRLFPEGYAQAFRRELAPMLRTYPRVRVWHAGCSTGEEVYATAILLYEEGLLARTTVYATEMNEVLVEHAQRGVFRARFDAWSHEYQEGGGKGALEDYFVVDEDGVSARPMLRDRVVFSEHRLASDASFNEFHLIVCRGFLRQSGVALRERTHRLLYESLCRFGYLALGPDDGMAESPHRSAFETMDVGAILYRRVR